MFISQNSTKLMYARIKFRKGRGFKSHRPHHWTTACLKISADAAYLNRHVGLTDLSRSHKNALTPANKSVVCDIVLGCYQKSRFDIIKGFLFQSMARSTPSDSVPM